MSTIISDIKQVMSGNSVTIYVKRMNLVPHEYTDYEATHYVDKNSETEWEVLPIILNNTCVQEAYDT